MTAAAEITGRDDDIYKFRVVTMRQLKDAGSSSTTARSRT